MKNSDEVMDLTNNVLSGLSEKSNVKPKSAKRVKKSTITSYKYPLIEVIWDDASTDNGWEPVPEELKAELVTTVGFLVRETDKHLLIANSYDPNHTNGRIQIPVGMIVSRKVIL